MPGPRGAEYLVAVGLAVLVAAGAEREPAKPPAPRHDGPRALWHIPDGPAMPASEPVRVEVPRAGISAPVLRVGKNADGTVEVPPLHSPGHAGWYRHGPPPGARGPAVVLGHYDDLRGPAAFYRLDQVRPGDVVRVVRRDGTTASFRVDATERVDKRRFPSQRVYGTVHYAGLRLVTCGGRYDPAGRSYRDNLIVYAHLVMPRRADRPGPRAARR